MVFRRPHIIWNSFNSNSTTRSVGFTRESSPNKNSRLKRRSKSAALVFRRPLIIWNSLNSTMTTRSVGFACESSPDENSRLKR